MEQSGVFHVRMRAAKGGAHEVGGMHISGGEKLSSYEKLTEHINELVEKAFSHSRGNPDYFQVKVEAVTEPISFVSPLKPIHYLVPSVEKGSLLVKNRLACCGIRKAVIEKGFQLLEENYHVRGALLIDVETGERIDGRKDRGVRVSAFDWHEKSFTWWLAENRLTEQVRMKEAVALASKVCAHEWTVAEVCWSDDPDYVTGYVASPLFGYERVSQLKTEGDHRGGRLLFVRQDGNLDTYIHYLEKTPVWIGWEEEK